MILWPPFSAWLFIIKIAIRIFGTELQTLCGIDDSDIEVLNNNNYYKYLASFLRCQL